MDMLKSENELERLLNEARRYPNAVFWYGDVLCLIHNSEAIELAGSCIRKESSAVSLRRGYKRFAEKLEQLAGFGAKAEALALADELLELYPRRTAMREELNKTKARIQRGQTRRAVRCVNGEDREAVPARGSPARPKGAAHSSADLMESLREREGWTW